MKMSKIAARSLCLGMLRQKAIQHAAMYDDSFMEDPEHAKEGHRELAVAYNEAAQLLAAAYVRKAMEGGDDAGPGE